MDKDIIVARATPQGTAALAVIRVSGESLGSLGLFEHAPLKVARRAYVRTYRGLAGQVLDEVLVLRYEHGASYTGEAMLEINTHGNPHCVQAIVADLQARGARMAQPGEFTKRAFLNGRMDLSQAEAVAHMIHARSEKALALAHKQLKGALGNKIHALSQELIGVLAQLEAHIDFSEEDLPAASLAHWDAALEGLLRQIDALLSNRTYTQRLYEGLKLVIIGDPNAGKSSLLNALLGEDRALVSHEPGTTRDFIKESWLLGDYPVQLIDTAGLREAAEGLEAQGIAKTLALIPQADLFLLAIDGSREVPELPQALQESLHAGNTLLVETKSDLPKLQELHTFLPHIRHVSVSALKGLGLATLKAALLALLDTQNPGEDVIAVHQRHAQALEGAKKCLMEARKQLKAQAFLELVSSDVRLALEFLGEIVGKVDNEAVLDVLFNTFCIGK